MEFSQGLVASSPTSSIRRYSSSNACFCNRVLDSGTPDSAPVKRFFFRPSVLLLSCHLFFSCSAGAQKKFVSAPIDRQNWTAFPPRGFVQCVLLSLGVSRYFDVSLPSHASRPREARIPALAFWSAALASPLGRKLPVSNVRKPQGLPSPLSFR